MALVDQRLDSKAVDEKSLLHWINRQLRPVVIKMRDVVNARTGGYYAETFGDGVTTSFVLTHRLGSRDVCVQTYDPTTLQAISLEAPNTLERTDEDSVTLGFAVAPGSGAVRAVVRL